MENEFLGYLIAAGVIVGSGAFLYMKTTKPDRDKTETNQLSGKVNDDQQSE